MKKTLMLMVMLGAFSSSFAFLNQSNWRWRNNDGTETTATWKAGQSTAITYNSKEEILRLRIELYNGTSDVIGLDDTLQYTTTPAVASSWISIPADDESRAFVIAGANGVVAQDDPTTPQITGNAYTFVAGKLVVDSALARGVSVPPSNRTEVEWAIRGTVNTLPNTTYYFRHWGSSSNSLPPGITYPSLTTSATVPILLTGFEARTEGAKVKLQWSTTQEQNNDRFEVEKSSDGNTWSTVATVKGKGTINQVSNYSAYDDQPFNGANYYRLKQYDLDGRSNVSAIRLLSFEGRRKSLLTLSPNPARGSVNFKLGQANPVVLATITDANGKVIYQDKIKNIQANTINQLNLKQQPAPGIYILKLKGEGLSETIKVVIQ